MGSDVFRIDDNEFPTHNRSKCGPGGATFLSGGAIQVFCQYPVQTFDFPELEISWTSERCAFCSSGIAELEANNFIGSNITAQEIEDRILESQNEVREAFLSSNALPSGFEAFGSEMYPADMGQCESLPLADMNRSGNTSILVKKLVGKIFITKCRFGNLTISVKEGGSETNIYSSHVQNFDIRFTKDQNISLTIRGNSELGKVDVQTGDFDHINIVDSSVQVFDFGKTREVNSTIGVRNSHVIFEGGDFRGSKFFMTEGLLLSDCVVLGAAWFAPQITSWQALKIRYNKQSGIIFGLLLILTLFPIGLSLFAAISVRGFSGIFQDFDGIFNFLNSEICSKVECSEIPLLQLVVIGREFTFSSVSNISLIFANLVRFYLVTRVAEIGEYEVSTGRHPRYGTLLPKFSLSKFLELELS